MEKESTFPLIATELDLDKENPHYPIYLQLVSVVLKKIIPDQFFQHYHALENFVYLDSMRQGQIEAPHSDQGSLFQGEKDRFGKVRSVFIKMLDRAFSSIGVQGSRKETRYSEFFIGGRKRATQQLRERNALSNIFHENTLDKVTDIPIAQSFPGRGIYHTRLQIEGLNRYFKSLLPLISSTPFNQAPANISFFAVINYRQNAFKFFFEMISRWLVPGKRLNVVLVHAIDFVLPELSKDRYSLCEVAIRIEDHHDLEELQRNFPIIESELRLGIVSGYYAGRILEVKGLSNDEQTAMIQERIAWIASHWKENFSSEVFTEMQHVLVMCRDDFKSIREVRHLSRIIVIQYLFRKDLRAKVKEEPKKRHFSLKIFQAKIRVPEGEKRVLGIIFGVNFLQSKEVLEEGHLIKAVQSYIPEARLVENSFFFNRRARESFGTFYFEIEKTDQKNFEADEIALLRKELPFDLVGRIEHLMHPVFMPRNEEEVMRNILTLSDQIKYVYDMPQMFISFEEQTHYHLFFTVILVRVLKENVSQSLEEAFKKNSSFEYFHDRTKMMAPFRKKYAKEATVFRLKIAKEPFLRPNYSIDLNKARQAVSQEMTRVIGEVRDYNGGMISKQNELLDNVKDLLRGRIKYNEVLLENFFYSMHPVMMRSILEAEAFKKLFLMFLECISSEDFWEEGSAMQVRAEPNFVYVIIGLEGFSIKNEIESALKQLKLPSFSLASTVVSVDTLFYAGYIFRSADPLKQRKFCQAIQQAAIAPPDSGGVMSKAMVDEEDRSDKAFSQRNLR